jgi:hypothetical protein
MSIKDRIIMIACVFAALAVVWFCWIFFIETIAAPADRPIMAQATTICFIAGFLFLSWRIATDKD